MLIKKNIFKDIASINSNLPPEEESHNLNEDFIDEKELSQNENNKADLNEKEAALLARLNAIKEESKQIIDNAKQKAQQITEAANETLQEKMKEFLAEKENSFNSLERKALEEVENIVKLQKNIIGESKQTIINLAIQLASKLINKEVSEDKSILENLIKSAINDLSMNSDEESLKMNIAVNPAEIDLAQQFIENLMEVNHGKLELTASGNKEISLGSCILEMPSGSVDLNFSSQMQLFKEKLLLINSLDKSDQAEEE
jgi:flagellar assembly protein FliH